MPASSGSPDPENEAENEAREGMRGSWHTMLSEIEYGWGETMARVMII